MRDDSCTYLEFPGRLFFCGNCSFNAELSASKMRYYLDSYLGLIVENKSHMECKVDAFIKDKKENYQNNDNKVPVPIHHVLYMNYAIPTSTNLEAY